MYFINGEELVAMSYDLHITKADQWALSEKNPITKDDLNKVIGLLEVYKGIPFLFQNGRITLCGANERVIGLMLEIAAKINARVQGDEGEFYDNIDKSNADSLPYLRMVSELNITKSDMNIPDDQRKFNESLQVGDEVEHPKYGTGKIQEITGQGMDTEFKVTFLNGNRAKRLLAYHTPIRPFES